MNRERAKELLPIIEAFANGEDIQFRWKGIDWDDCNDFMALGMSKVNEIEFRIKPSPREWDVLVDEHGWILTIRQDGEGERDWIKVREVLDENL